jgi:hypothetical protein
VRLEANQADGNRGCPEPSKIMEGRGNCGFMIHALDHLRLPSGEAK